MRSTVVSAVLIAGVAAQWTGAAPAAAAGAAPVASNPALGATSFAANPSLGASFAANPSFGASLGSAPSFAANPSLGASATLGASSAVRSTTLGAAPAAQPALGANFGAPAQPALGANFGAAAQPTLGAAPAAGATRAALPASAGATTLAAPTASSGAATRGLPIGTVNGIQDSDVVCAQNGYQGAACGLQNVASIYNPNPAMRYQTQYSDNALSLLQSTNRYNAAGQRIINPATGNAAMDLGTLDIPTQNAIASGVTTTFTNDPTRSAVQSTTTWLNNGALANYVTPSASNAVLPNSVAFQQANAAPWTTTPVNTLTGAGFGYSTLQGVTAGTVKAPVPSTPTVPTAPTFGFGAPTTFGAALPATFSTAGTFPTTFSTGFAASTLPANAWAAQPFTGTTSFLPAATTSYLPPTTTFGTSFQTFPSAPFPSATFPATTTQFGLGSTYQLPNYQPAVNPAAQPFTNAYSTPGLVGPPSQAGIVNRPF